jgi:hypothetical protein
LDASFERGTHGKAGFEHPPCKTNATARAVEGNLGGFCVCEDLNHTNPSDLAAAKGGTEFQTDQGSLLF